MYFVWSGRNRYELYKRWILRSGFIACIKVMRAARIYKAVVEFWKCGGEKF